MIQSNCCSITSEWGDVIVGYKLIEHERVGDAPFIGALISATNCHNQCIGCFNQHIKEMPTKYATARTIITTVKNNCFNEGIILAGLEWGEQFDEAIALAMEAKKRGLNTMLYTGNEDLIFVSCFDYIKTGAYIETLKSDDHFEYGVKLASKNQHIYKRCSGGWLRQNIRKE